MPCKNRAKLLQKSETVPKKYKKSSNRIKKLTKSHINEPNQFNCTQPGKQCSASEDVGINIAGPLQESCQGAKTVPKLGCNRGIKIAKNKPGMKLAEDKFGMKLAKGSDLGTELAKAKPGTKLAKKPKPGIKLASAKTMPAGSGTKIASAKSRPPKPGTELANAKTMPRTGRSSRKRGTNLAKKPAKSLKTGRDAAKIVTSQDDTSQIEPRFSAPHSENGPFKGLGGSAKASLKLGHNKAATPRKLPKTQPKARNKDKLRRRGVGAKTMPKERLQSEARPKTQPKPAIQDLKSLQKTWYAKLKAEGFQDIETITKKEGLDGPLKSSKGSQPMQNYETAALQYRELYYRRLTNYLTHNPNWSGVKAYNLIAALYVEGVSYRKMLPKLEAIGYSTNIWRVHKVVRLFEARSKVWNRMHVEGLDFEAAE